MFVRPSWTPRPEDVFALIDRHPWARLISNGEACPLVTNLPLLLDRSRGAHGILVGHLARSNDHAHALVMTAAPTLAVFEGPWNYVSASWYPARQMPPTYYYTAVHCYGRVRVQNDDELESSLDTLTSRMESPLAGGWRTGEIPRSEITRRMPAILGFELEIDRIESKFKLGQDEQRRDALAVADRLSASTEPALQSLGDLVRRYNADRPEADTE